MCATAARDREARNNAILTGVLRVFGLALLYFGAVLVQEPVQVLLAGVPFVGGVLAFGLSAFTLVTSLSIGALVIAAAWLFSRPVMALGLVAVATVMMLYVGNESA